jgi:uncharacterized protein YecT (DUF1311 family)
VKFLATAFFLLALPTFAQDSSEYRACIEKAKTQTEMNTCACEEAARADAKLNEAYRMLLERAAGDSELLTKLKAAENAWVAYRDAYMDAMYPAKDKQAEYGSVYPMESDLLRSKLTERQVQALADLFEPLQGGTPRCVLSTASDGQTLTVKGKVRNGAHDMAFEIPGCDATILLTFAGDKDNDVSGTELRKDDQLRRFQKYTSSVYKSAGKNICMACAKYADVQAELTGKLQIATMPPGATRDMFGFIRDQSGKIIGQFGWGHPTPFAGYRLVIQSVADVKARKQPLKPAPTDR